MLQLDIDEEFNVNFVGPKYASSAQAYNYFMGDRPDDYDLIQYDWFFYTFDQILYYAERYVNMLANKGFFNRYYYGFSHFDTSTNLGVSH